MKKPKTSQNYEFFIRADTSKYKGEWVAIANKKIISHGKDAEDVYKKAKEKAKSNKVSLAKVPDREILVLLF